METGLMTTVKTPVLDNTKGIGKEPPPELMVTCGCCEDDIEIGGEIQCMENHIFCRYCARRYAETIIGNRDGEISCLQRECKSSFSHLECVKFLHPNQLRPLVEIQTEKAVKAAGLENFASCPYCNFGYEIVDSNDNLFYCLNGCQKVTCRLCRRPMHEGKTCQDVAREKENTRHHLEDAMSAAIMRRCPCCSTAVEKIDGCNKMTCKKCFTLFCMVCLQQIKDPSPYHHFNSIVGGHITTDKPCDLYDRPAQLAETQKALEMKVEAARKAFIEELRVKDPNNSVFTAAELPQLGREGSASTSQPIFAPQPKRDPQDGSTRVPPTLNAPSNTEGSRPSSRQSVRPPSRQEAVAFSNTMAVLASMYVQRPSGQAEEVQFGVGTGGAFLAPPLQTPSAKRRRASTLGAGIGALISASGAAALPPVLPQATGAMNPAMRTKERPARDEANK